MSKPLLLIAVCLASTFSLVAFGADDDPQAEKKQRLEEMKRQATEYEVKLTTAKPMKLPLHDEPLLRFDNPVSGVPDGIVVMWKDGPRPAILAQVFQTKEGLWIHECQSLARVSLEMERAGAVLWSPQAGAEDFHRLEASSEAADSPAKRLVQMKKLAAEFTAFDDFKIRFSDKETTRHNLRMLTTPVYRYSDKEHGITDAAVFAFVHGTDPELFLILEHRGKEGWHYAMVPMTCWGVEARRNDKIVWSVPERFGKNQAKSDYHVWVYRANQDR